MQRKLYTLALLFLFCNASSELFNPVFAQTQTLAEAEAEKDRLAELYVNQFFHFAIEEMHRTGIPASITLAQGLHESDYGRSRLARLANNHFGAKAHNTWQGPTLRHDDDAPQERFRKYESVEHSYRDHSKVLAKKRYAFLYSLDGKDYVRWAHGLKKAGYATDPNYAYKLIRIIERYQLQRFNDLTPTFVQAAPVVTSSKRKKRKKKATVTQKQQEMVTLQPTPEPNYGVLSASYTKPTMPPKPKRVRYTYQTIIPKNADEMALDVATQNELETAIQEAQTFEKPAPTWFNGSRVVYFESEKTPAEVAFWYELDLKKLLAWNYANAETTFLPKTPVYIEGMRRKSGSFAATTHEARRGEQLRDIALRYGVRLSRLEKLNKIDGDAFIKAGEMVHLKRKRRRAVATLTTDDFQQIERMAILTTAKVACENIEYPSRIHRRERPVYQSSFYLSKGEESAPKSSVIHAVKSTVSEGFENKSQTIAMAAVESSNIIIAESKSQNPSFASNAPFHHRVQAGETLYRLSVIYEMDVEKIKALNKLTNNTIHVGHYIRIR